MIVFEHPNIVILVLFVAICIMLKIFIPLYKENEKLTVECRYLEKELKKIKQKYGNLKCRSREYVETIKAEHEKEIGQVVKSDFDDIVFSFIDSKTLAPNVSVEHLTRLCNVPEANDRFFRALLQDFEIENLVINRVGEKHNIKMRLKSGKNKYTTTLTTCSCRDFYKVDGQKVCKHMYFLAITLGLISREHYESFRDCALKELDNEKIAYLQKRK